MGDDAQPDPHGRLTRARAMDGEVPPGVGTAQAAVLVGLAGFTDVIGFIALDHLFLSFMSGNTTQLGIALVFGDTRTLSMLGLIVGCFVAGTVSGPLLRAVPTRAPLILLAELACFVLAWRLGWLVACAFAMGAQNAIPRQLGGLAPARTFMTGTLVSFGQSVGEALLQRSPGERRQKIALAGAYGATWLLFLVGGLCGAASMRLAGGLDGALAIGSGVLGALVISALIWPGRGRARG